MSDATAEAAHEYQRRILPHVSRTFALTVPQLPPPLGDIVSNAYLLCRIADTIEDDPSLSGVDKSEAHEEFLAVLRGEADGHAFGTRVAEALSAKAPPRELELVRHADRVVRCTHAMAPGERAAIERCAAIMCRGMSLYQHNASIAGLADLTELDRYCYCVAGVVGEMLTELFALHSAGVRARRDEMLALAPSFGEGLQLTNILKDTWDDRRRSACWLPRDVFARHGVDLAALQPGEAADGFARAMDELVALAHGHLRNALEYTLMIPPADTGMRRFCLWAIGLALRTLQRIHRNPAFTRGEQVKISRTMVHTVVTTTNLAARHDRLLRLLFAIAARGLPLQQPVIDADLSEWRNGGPRAEG